MVGKGYRFIGEVSAPEPPAAVQPEPAIPPPNRRRALLAVSGLGSVLAVAAIVALPNVLPRNAAPLTIVPFTAIPGLQSWPAFSPDGDQVAFGRTGETGNCSHIYVMAVGGVSPHSLTDAIDCDSSPSWSRDGRRIAFLCKQAGGPLALYVIPAAGGTARRIGVMNGPSNYRPAWTPDGKALVIMHAEPPEAPPALFGMAIDSGEKRRYSTAEPASTGDWCPAYSPDGRTLAYLHNTGSRRLSPLYVVPVDKHGLPSANPGKMETGSTGFVDFDWSADSRSLICTTPCGLVRVSASSGAVEPLPFPDGIQPTVALHGYRMVYVRPFRDTDIFRVPGPGAAGPATRLIASTRQEFAPQYSNRW